MEVLRKLSQFDSASVAPSVPDTAPQEANADALEVAAIMEQGAQSADIGSEPVTLGTEPAQTQPLSPWSEPTQPQPRKRGRPRKNPLAADAAAAIPKTSGEVAMSAMLNPEYIGRIWTTGLNTFYRFCDAEQMNASEEVLHREAFTAVCRHYFPKSAEGIHPVAMLAAVTAMSTLPRLNPIAEKSAPFWKRAFDWMKSRISGE